jgi:hypothetical protein
MASVTVEMATLTRYPMTDKYVVVGNTVYSSASLLPLDCSLTWNMRDKSSRSPLTRPGTLAPLLKPSTPRFHSSVSNVLMRLSLCLSNSRSKDPSPNSRNLRHTSLDCQDSYCRESSLSRSERCILSLYTCIDSVGTDCS